MIEDEEVKLRRKKADRKYRQSPAGKANSKKNNKIYRQSSAGSAARKKAAKEYHLTFCGHLHWRHNSLKQRCNNVNDTGYSRYGAVGVRCLFTFKSFYDHVVNDLSYDTVAKLKGLDIHRIDNKDYRRGNIEFLTRKQHAAKHKELNKLKKKETVV